jgi:hypothetical protein
MWHKRDCTAPKLTRILSFNYSRGGVTAQRAIKKRRASVQAVNVTGVERGQVQEVRTHFLQEFYFGVLERKQGAHDAHIPMWPQSLTHIM